MQKIKWTDKDIQILRDNYRSMETFQLANLLNRTKSSISGKLHKLKLSRDKKTYYIPEDVLIPLHGLTINKIAEKLNVSKQQARAYIKHNNIATSKRWWTPEEDKIIIDNYQSMFSKDLHKTFFPNISFQAVRSRVAHLGLVKEDRGKLLVGYKAGENSANWKGGIAFEPYCYKFNDALKEQIRNKFDRKCTMCGISESEYMSNMENAGKRPCKLHVHHVGSDKMQGCDGIKFNLVPLCAPCHTRMHWKPGTEKVLIDKLNIGNTNG